MGAPITLTATTARRLAVAAQQLSGPYPAADARGLLDLVRQITCLQLDPINVVARSHLLVLWSRLGDYDRGVLDQLLWQDRSLFEYWAHAASIVLTDDYQIHRQRMRSWGQGAGVWRQRIRDWMESNKRLRLRVLRQLRAQGPLPLRSLQHEARGPADFGWGNERTISFMLDALLMRGEVMVAGRTGGQKLWDLAERCLPEWTPRGAISERGVVRRAVLRSLAALGVARPRDIAEYFIRGRYTGLPAVLAELTAKRLIERVEVVEGGAKWQGAWYMRREDLTLVEQAKNGWQPRTALLSPFDNLIADRKRTEKLFGFHFRTEIYVPKAQRKFGYYLLPILHGESLIGRVDARFERARGELVVNAVHLEDGAPDDAAAGHGLRSAFERLAAWLGAGAISYGVMPPAWSRLLR